jgi:tetratricopeptide (TPR) repeat protein
MPAFRLVVPVLLLVLASCSGGPSESDLQEMAALFAAQADNDSNRAVALLPDALAGVSDIDVEAHRELQRWLNHEAIDAAAVRSAYAAYASDHPREPGAQYLLGRLSDGKAAVELFRKSLEVDPEFAWGHRAVGLASLAEGDSNSAVDHLEKAVAARPDWNDLYYRLGQAWHLHGDWEKALTYFKQDLALQQVAPQGSLEAGTVSGPNPDRIRQIGIWNERAVNVLDLQLTLGKTPDSEILDRVLTAPHAGMLPKLIRICLRIGDMDRAADLVDRFWDQNPDANVVYIDILISGDSVYQACATQEDDLAFMAGHFSRGTPQILTDAFAIRRSAEGVEELLASNLSLPLSGDAPPDVLIRSITDWETIVPHDQLEYFDVRQAWLDFIRWPEENR